MPKVYPTHCKDCGKQPPDVTFAITNDCYRTVCIDCFNARKRKRRIANPEQHRKWGRDYVHKHPDIIKQRNDSAKGYRTKRMRDWRKIHKTEVAEANALHKARQMGVEIGEVDYNHVLQRHGLWCYICRQPIVSGQDFHFDHVIPFAKQGSHTTSNVFVTHAICNRRKADKLVSELTSEDRKGP